VQCYNMLRIKCMPCCGHRYYQHLCIKSCRLELITVYKLSFVCNTVIHQKHLAHCATPPPRPPAHHAHPLALCLQLHCTLHELNSTSPLVCTDSAGLPMIVQQEPRHQHNGISKGSTSPAQGSTIPASAHRPDVHVSNVILDISTGVVATLNLTQGDIL